MAQKTLTLLLVAMLVMTVGVSAKPPATVPATSLPDGGCAAFGHSCYGGHGKRSSDNAMIDTSNPVRVERRHLGQEETPAHPMYPQSGLSALFASDDDIIPVRDGGAYEKDENNAAQDMKYKLRSLVKRWMENYRRSQNNDDNGYLIETL